jgi:hypothetical protein
MEASGNPPPPEEPTPPRDPAPATPSAATPPPPPPPPAGTTDADDGKAGGGWRALGFILFLALAFACAVMAIAMADIGDTPLHKDCIAENAQGGHCTEYFDGSSAQKTATLVLGWPSAVLAGIAALVALFFVFTGRRGRLLLTLTGAAIALGAISILIGSV